jgi:hypothetical protein
MGLRDDFLTSPAPVPLLKQDVTDELPELAGWLKDKRLFVRELDGSQRNAMEMEQGDMRIGEDGKPVLKFNTNSTREPRLLCWCLVGADDQRIFEDSDEEIVSKKLPGRIQNKLAKLILEVSGIGREAKAKLEKNSRKAAGGASASGSPATSNGQTREKGLPELAAAN